MMDLTLVTIGLTFALGYSAVSGQTDHCIKSSPHIIQCDLGCIPGFYGLYCNETCSSNCHLACSQDNGTCLTGCDRDWFKSNCTKECIGHCINDVCDMRNGDCIYGCVDGYYGTACDKTCSENCTEGVCDVFGGCTCRKGVEDMACYLDCSDNCLDGQCDMDPNGRLKCLKGCQEGRTGPFCQEWCPEGCSSCNSEGICMNKLDRGGRTKRELQNCLERNGTECVCCKEKWRGRRCDIGCPACRYNYRQGKCIHSCDGGYFGEICRLSCPEYCELALNGRSGCEKDTGKCHSGCLQGFYGPKCQDECSINCNNSRCFQNNGSCVACDRNKYGPQCENTCGHCKNISCGKNGTCTCEDGWYGPTCVHKCADKCLSDICKIEYTGSHFCAGACVYGYTGDDCLSRCPQGCEKCNRKNGTCTREDINDLNIMTGNVSEGSPGLVTTIKILAIVIAVIVAAVVVAFFACWVRKCRSKENRRHTENKETVKAEPETQEEDTACESQAASRGQKTSDETGPTPSESVPLLPQAEENQNHSTKLTPTGLPCESQAASSGKPQEDDIDIGAGKNIEQNKGKEEIEMVETSKQQYRREVKLPNTGDMNHEDECGENKVEEVGLKLKGDTD